MRKINLLSFLVMLMIMSIPVFAGSVTRSFSQATVHPGETLKVNLQIQDNVDVIEEFLPSSEWEIINMSDNGFLLNSMTLNWIGFPSVLQGTLTYNVLVPSTLGNYSFNGNFGSSGNSQLTNTLGAKTVIVENQSNEDTLAKIVINEFMSNTPSGVDEWIELYNKENFDVNLDGWTIEDGTNIKYSLNGSIIPSNGYYILTKGAEFNFALNNGGDTIILKKNETEVDKVAYGDFNDGNVNDNADAPDVSESSGRLPNGQDTDVDTNDFTLFQVPTMGSGNTVPVPQLNIIKPTNGQIINSTEILVEFNTENFQIGGKGDSHLHIYLDNDNTPYMFFNGADRMVEYNSAFTSKIVWIATNKFTVYGFNNSNHTIKLRLAITDQQELYGDGEDIANFVISVDIAPPGPITNLQASTITNESISWTWNSPNDLDFSQAIIILNGINVINTSNNYYNAIGLDPDKLYTITINTKDSNGNINTNVVSNTQKTLKNAPPLVLDDLEVNYLRGKISYDGVPAPLGTSYELKTEGTNGEFIYNGNVDNLNIPNHLKGNGYFDTRDNINFSTGNNYLVKASGCSITYSGKFTNGGDGDFNDPNSLLQIKCLVPPVINDYYHTPINPNELSFVTIKANATDNFGVDSVVLFYRNNNSDYTQLKMTKNTLYTADIGNVLAGKNYEYYILANDTYGNNVQTAIKSFTVIALDKDNDGYDSLNDCNDDNSLINPGKTEVCNGIDENCNSKVDEGYDDLDNDTIADCVDNVVCLDKDKDIYYGYAAKCTTGNDCDDLNNSVSPGAQEVCNSVDDNCNGQIDENFDDLDSDNIADCVDSVVCLDNDLDSYYGKTSKCSSGTDCNDINLSINPNAVELDNGVDDDCDSSIDEGFDKDNDTYTPLFGKDCNDNNASVNPGAAELDNGVDDDCDSSIDEGFDKDGDGYTPIGGNDCNDYNISINPGAIEIIYNGVDEDCSSETRDDDLDSDNYNLTNDCNDNNSAIHPGAVEIIDKIDQNCVDDGPNLTAIPDQNWDEDKNLTLNLSKYFYDVDGDEITYNSTMPLNITVIIEKDAVNFVPDPNWNGESYILFFATSKDKNKESNNIKLAVRSINDIPKLIISNQSIDEDTSLTLDLNNYSSDVEGSKLAYKVTSEDTNKVNCEIDDNMLFITPINNFFGDSYCTITANDSIDNSVPSTFLIKVMPVNDAPVINWSSVEFNEDSSFNFELNGIVNDVDNADSELTWSYTGNQNVDISINSNNIAAFSPKKDYNGIENVIFTVTDPINASDSETIVVTVKPINDAPELGIIQDITVNENQLVEVKPKAIDVDNDELTFLFSGPLNQSGQWLTDFNESGVYYVTVTVSDGNGGYDSQTIMITIKEFGNHNPVLEPINDITVTEGQLVDLTLYVDATDLDHDLLTFSYPAPFNSNGKWQTTFKDAAVYNASVTVSDGKATDKKYFTVSVIEAGNQAPVIQPINNVQVIEGNLLKVVPSVEDPDGDQVNITFSSPLDNKGEWQTGFKDAGNYPATIEATDGLLTSKITFTITVVDAGNQAPVIDDITDKSITEGDLFKIVPTASDPDGDELIFVYSSPLNSNGEWQTTFKDSGNYTVIVTAKDNKSGSDSTSFKLTVIESGNHEPIVENVMDILVTEGQLVSVNVNANDPDGDKLTITYSEKLDSSGKWQTTFVDAGIYHVFANVSDGTVTISKGFYITVMESGNHDPKAEITGNLEVFEGEEVVINVKTSDPDDDNIVVEISEPMGNDGRMDTTGLKPGKYEIIITLDDGTTKITKIITITIREKPFEQLYIGNINFVNGEDVDAGNYLDVDVSFTNMGNVKMREVKAAAIDYETGERVASQPITLGFGDTKTKRLRVYVPEDARKGQHELRFTFSNDNVRRVAFRDYFVK